MGEGKPFRFGVTRMSAGSRHEWVEKARTLEALGYSVMTVPDHIPDRLAAVPALMAAADATETLRVASWVFCNDFRHPVMLYKEAATLDLLSGGRFELGIGAGWLNADYDTTGIPFDRPGVRVSRMFEAVHILKGLAADGPLDFQGEHYTISGLEGAPKPLQKLYPPLYIGGGGKRLLTFAAREADIVGFAAKALPEGGLDVLDIRAEAFERKLGWVREAAEAASRDPELNIVNFVFEETDNPRAAAERHAERLPGLTPDEVLASPYTLIGTLDQMAEELHRRRAEYGLTYTVINTGIDDHARQFAPVVEMLAGQ